MYSSTSRTLAVSLLAVALVLAIAVPVDAKDYPVYQRDHVNLKRLVKKRSPFPQTEKSADSNAGVVAGAAADPTPDSSTAAPTSTSLSVSSASTSGSGTSSVTSSKSTGTISNTNTATSSSTGTVTSSIASSSSTIATSSSTATSTSATQSTTQETLNLSAEPTNSIASTPPTRTSQALVTETQTVQASDTPVPEAQSNAAKTKSTTLTALIIAASCVGGVAILWTVFRKWKLGRSSKFDERLQPIDWQPTNPDDGIIPAHRRTSSRASSFQSGSGHGHGPSALQPVPDHDFTAPSSTVGGYVDLARGPSPPNQMQEPLARGPSLTRGYDVGVPLHHQAGYGSHDAYDYNGGAVRY